jgi:chromosome segregation ATPase
MKFLRGSLIGLFLLLAGVGQILAQTETEEMPQADKVSVGDEDWQKTIDHVTTETNSLLTENEKLNTEYEFLQKKAASLRAELEKTRSEVKKLPKQKLKNEAVVTENTDSTDMEEMAKLQKEIDAAEEVNKGLQKKLADIQEKNRLWKLQASQLENKKRDANLDLNYQQSQSAAAAKAAGATDDLQAQLVQSLKEEKELTLALDKLSAQKDTLPKETAALKKKNVELGNRVKDLKKQIAAQETKNEKMQKAALKGVGAAGGQRVSPDLLKKKKELENEVAKLTAQLDGVNATVNQSKDVLGKKRQLMDQIMYLDAQNQTLRSQIDEMLSQPR